MLSRFPENGHSVLGQLRRVSKAGQVWQWVPHHAGSSDRLGRARACAGLEARLKRRSASASIAAPGNPGIGAMRHESSRSTSPTTRRSSAFCPSRTGSISSSSARRRRSSPASSTISRRRASRRSGRAAAAAQLEGSKALHQGALRRGRHPDGAPTGASPTPAAAQAPMCAAEGAPIVVKADGLAAGKGVVVAASVAEARARRSTTCFGGALRRSRRRGRDRGVPRRRGGELLRALRRHDRAPARHRPGPQARLRRRHAARTPAAWAPIRRPRC